VVEVRSTFDAPQEVGTAIGRMRALSVRALARMYLPTDRMFCHCVRRRPGGNVPEGVSRRYTAITLLGLALQQHDLSPDVFGGGDDSRSVCERLLADVAGVENLGDVALTLWAAKLLRNEDAARALDRLRSLDPVGRPHSTVEIAWALTALSVRPGEVTDEALCEGVANRLLRSFRAQSGLFPHWPPGVAPSPWRAHVSCFADWVYPVQALAHYYRATGCQEAIDKARRSAESMCRLQGSAGQWWWHYDVRTGRVVEGYPVYSVHQDAMGPMALLDLQGVCGARFDDAIARSVSWMVRNPERGDSLIDEEAGLIWRKVCRREPGKLSRGIQALASRMHPALRARGLNVMFPPNQVDYECRPYHLGWLLYAFSDRRLSAPSLAS
jgi:hypothetical protein